MISLPEVAAIAAILTFAAVAIAGLFAVLLAAVASVFSITADYLSRRAKRSAEERK